MMASRKVAMPLGHTPCADGLLTSLSHHGRRLASITAPMMAALSRASRVVRPLPPAPGRCIIDSSRNSDMLRSDVRSGKVSR